MNKIGFCTLFFVLFSCEVLAAKPVCNSHTDGDYLQYTGKVDRIYVNAGNLILIYFDTPISISEAATCGFTITNGTAAAFKIDDNPEFARMFYSTALAAQASKRNISIQLKSVYSGYLRFDRIWLEE